MIVALEVHELSTMIHDILDSGVSNGLVIWVILAISLILLPGSIVKSGLPNFSCLQH